MIKFLSLLLVGTILNLTASGQLTILLGTWEMTTKTGKISETWKLQSDSLLGKSYKINLAGDSTLLETVVIKAIDNETYFCVTGAQEDKTKMVKFKLISFENSALIFENKSHDFPQRIHYKKTGEDDLLASIEGTVNGKKQEKTFPYKRKK